MSFKEHLKNTKSNTPAPAPVKKTDVATAVTKITEAKKHRDAKKAEADDTLPVVPHMHEGAEGFSDLHRRHLAVIAKNDPDRIKSMQNWD
jgi:hypothetical protein